MKHLLTVAICLFIFIGFSQEGKPKMTKKEFRNLQQEMDKIETSNVDSVMVLVDAMMRKAKSFNDEQIWASALMTKANIENRYINADVAIATEKEALKINKRLNNNTEIAKIYFHLGDYNFNKSNYKEATLNYLKVINITQHNDSATTILAYQGLSDVSDVQGNLKDALKYALLTKKYTNKNTSEKIIAMNAISIANAYESLNDIKKSERYFKEAIRLLRKNAEGYYLGYALYEYAGLFYNSDPLKSIDLRLEAQAIFDKVTPDRLTSGSNMDFLGELYVIVATNDSLIKKIKNPLVPKTKAGLLKEAELLYNKGLAIALKNNSIYGILSTREYLSQVQELTGNYKDAYLNLVEAKRMNDSLFSQENKNELAKLITEKEALELKTINEKEVSKLKAANDKKATLNKILIGSAISLLLMLLLGYRNFKHKRNLQNLKITELEKDKKLITVDAMLQGQEEERSRIAKDLHDGLGGLLSGTKLSFINMKENLILTPESAVQFDKSLNLLDATMVDLRKIAQNLMPEALVKFGINEALRDYCNSLQSSSQIIVNYQNIGVERKLPNTAEVFVYRIIQELTNNAVKHSKASEIIVQLAISETKISLTVEDNGIGYDKSAVESKEGSGLYNIADRVHYLNGSIDTVTFLNNGTSVNIELNV